jgi:hypothetical protein
VRYGADSLTWTGLNREVGNAKIHRIAVRVHRGQLFVAAGLFIDHLQRVADMVEARGGDSVTVQAAWLHAAPAAGDGPVDLLRQGRAGKNCRCRGCAAAAIHRVPASLHRPPST